MPGYLASVYLHILAALIWVGGMLFLTLVLVPVTLKMEPPRRGALLAEVGRRFRWVGWSCILVLAVTGAVNLSHRGISVADLFTGTFIAQHRGVVLLSKLIAVVVMVALSALHDFVLGPQVTKALQNAPQRVPALRRRTSWLARANLALGLAVLALAMFLVRG